MAIPVVNFISSIDDSSTPYKLILTDTTVYDAQEGPVIHSKYWIITRADGSREVISSPLGELSYEIKKDEAIIVQFALNYVPTTKAMDYFKQKSILVSPYLSMILYDMRKHLTDSYNGKKSDKEFKSFLEELNLITAFEKASRSLISTDIVAAQKALDYGNDKACTCKYTVK